MDYEDDVIDPEVDELEENGIPKPSEDDEDEEEDM